MGTFYDENVYPRAATLEGDEVFIIYQNATSVTTTTGDMVTTFIQPLIDGMSIGGLGDVDTSGVQDFDALIYNSENSTWEAGRYNLGDLSDVTISNVSAGDRVGYDISIGQWVNTKNFYIGYYGSTDGEIDALKTLFETSQQDVFDNWYRFSHTSSGVQPAIPSELNEWNYVDPNILCTINSSSYIGFISLDSYDTYTHESRVYSTNADDDMIGLVIAFAVDGEGFEHTLTAARSLGGASHAWAIYYNYASVGNSIIVSDSDSIKWGNGFTGATAAEAIGSGTGFSINVTALGTSAYGTGTIAASTLVSGGTGYQVNEQVRIDGGNNNAYATVTSVDGGTGEVLTYYMVSSANVRAGTGYTTGVKTTSNSGYISNMGLGWSNTYPTGTLINIDRKGDIITCNTTQLGSDVYVPAAELVVDLDSDPRLEIFKGPQRYGYSCRSQFGSTYSDITFSATDLIYDTRNGAAIYYEGSGVWLTHPTRTLYTDYLENTILYTESLQKAWLRAEDTTVVPFLSS
jgi:hypothetical protein